MGHVCPGPASPASSVPPCDVCGDTTGVHELWCAEGGGDADVIAAVVSVFPTADVVCEQTGGGCRAVIARFTDGRELWVTDYSGAHIAPSRGEPGWLVGVYPDTLAPTEGRHDAYVMNSGTTTLHLRMMLSNVGRREFPSESRPGLH